MIKKSSNEISTVYKAFSNIVKTAQPVPIDNTPPAPPTQPEPQPKSNNIGVMLAQRLTSALTGVDTNNYKARSEAIYGELSAIASELHEGDWVSFPDGTTFTMTFKPTARQAGKNRVIKTASGPTLKISQTIPPAITPNSPPPTPSAPIPQLDEFTKAYIEAALWSTTDESTPQGGEPLDKNYGIEDVSPETLQQMISDCKDFQEAQLTNGTPVFDAISSNLARAGQDFWLTRNRHGAGFWDGDWKQFGQLLTDFSHPYGEFNLYVGDDHKIHGQ